MNPLQALVALALIFILPGYFLVKAVFPRHRFSRDFHGLTVLFLSVVASVSLTILVTGALAFLPATASGRGLFQGAATGAPLIEAALGTLTLVLAGIATWRGAFRAERAMTEAREPAEEDALAEVTTSAEKAPR